DLRSGSPDGTDMLSNVELLQFADVTFATIGPDPTPGPNPAPPPGTSALMIMNSGVNYEIYDLGSNKVLDARNLGQVGTDWKFIGVGNFGGPAASDAMLRNVNSGALQVYNLNNNNIVNSANMGAVGLDWTTGGFGDFNGDGYTDMMLRNANSGGLEAYNI